jgi:hypothetical protein
MYENSKAVIGRGYQASIGPVATTGATPPTGLTGSTTSASTSVTAISSTAAIVVGMSVSGAGIPVGATVAAKTSTTITLSAAATATATAVALTFGTSGLYILLGEMDSSDSSGREWDIEEVTNFQSAVDKEHIKALRNPGTFTLQGNRVEDDAGQEALEAAFEDTAPYLFQIQLPPSVGLTTGEIWTFSALVLSVDPPAITPGKTIKYSAKLQVTGPRTITPAA